MGFYKRLILALSLLVFDLVVFFLPLSAILLGYVIMFNPPWAREFMDRLGKPA